MAEELRKALRGFRIWRNPATRNEPVIYLGIYWPPNGHSFFAPGDLQELGFGPGDYTVLVPEEFRRAKLFSKWQKVSVPE
jgi:hypothetical protein